jgi:hypothetical protein
MVGDEITVQGERRVIRKLRTVMDEAWVPRGTLAPDHRVYVNLGDFTIVVGTYTKMNVHNR